MPCWAARQHLGKTNRARKTLRGNIIHSSFNFGQSSSGSFKERAQRDVAPSNNLTSRDKFVKSVNLLFVKLTLQCSWKTQLWETLVSSSFSVTHCGNGYCSSQSPLYFRPRMLMLESTRRFASPSPSRTASSASENPTDKSEPSNPSIMSRPKDTTCW